ncbi:MAG: hypothetical protein HQK96_21690 [Nitrospirae bacterium]|nr:hypothetical protein [Nitrospirota bacterium]
MRKYPLWLLASVTFVVVSALLAAIAVTVGELSFYISTGNWYFTSNNQNSSKSHDMALYRESFSIKKSGRIRILAIGGSTTYGFGVAPENTWPKILAEKLEKAFPGKYEVINLGRIGGHLEEFIQNYHTNANIEITREKWISGIRPAEKDISDWGWKDLKPDIILIAPVMNDTAPDYLNTFEPKNM